MAEAKKYVALEDFQFRGVLRKKGDIFRIADKKVAALGSKVQLADSAPAQGTPSQSAPQPSTPPVPKPAAPLPQPKMSQYKVKEAFELDGVQQEVDSQVELSDEKAAELGEKVEKVEEGA